MVVVTETATGGRGDEVVTVLATEEEAAVVVAETAREAEVSSASGRGGRSALRGAPMAPLCFAPATNGLLFAYLRVGPTRHFLLPGHAFMLTKVI